MNNIRKILAAITTTLILTGCTVSTISPDPADMSTTASSGTSVIEQTEPTTETEAPAKEPDEETSKETCETTTETTYEEATETSSAIDIDGSYTTVEDVSLYIYTYGELPNNFITKKEAKALGWEGGSLEPFAPGMCIGGDHFGNYEGLLPEKKGREYHECDIDTLYARSRGAKRIIYSNDGLIYYTSDHYESFELLYGEE